MACSSCGTGGCGSKTGGCGSKGGCSTGGCGKLNSYDWLGVMEMDAPSAFDIVEVKFKGGRKEFFRNADALALYTGDPVIVEMPTGYHLGYVSLQGDIVRLQMKKKNVANDESIKKILRVANQRDMDKNVQSINRENPTLYRTREMIRGLKLEMKLTDIEFQADNTKATFYYSADERVDFRELIKMLASEFKIRVEMKQISLRQEASRLGGIGSCGRELCCSTWLTDFKNVNTSAARYQNLALNPSKLSGQCGRLKCCLNYELDTYMESLKGIPEVEGPLHTGRGEALLQKTDIFKRVMWFSYRESADSNWVQVSVERVMEIQQQNKEGRKPANLLEDVEDLTESNLEIKREREELSRFDDKFSRKKKKRKKRPNSGTTGTQLPQDGPRPQRNLNQPPKNQEKSSQGNQQPKPNHPPKGQQGNKPAKQQGGEKQHQKNNQGPKQHQHPRQQSNQNQKQNPNQKQNNKQNSQNGQNNNQPRKPEKQGGDTKE
ncbi:MAG: Signal peptidase-like protein [Cytophagaceae bacterium]|jgi:cell fate regulator YaaT (PSP1 superfamily)|nr:Signal peptidase-like protein [Cytophagaceae bacterium]